MADVGVVHGPEGDNYRYFGHFWAAIVIVALWTFVLAFLLFIALDWALGLRVPPRPWLAHRHG